MKKSTILLMIIVIILTALPDRLSAICQSVTEETGQDRGDNSTKVVLGDNLVQIEDNDSAFNVRVGNRGLQVLESLEGRSSIEFEKYPAVLNDDIAISQQDEDRDERRYRSNRRNRFRAHWTGAEIGFNNYLTSDMSSVLPDEIGYMTLHSGKSINFNINFAQLNLGITRHIGFVTGLGLNWNNYKFDGNNNIIKGTNGIIEELDPGALLKKSKLTTLYVNLPFLLEIQIPVHNNSINIAAGPVGSVKLASHSKMVFDEDDQKVKSNGDFSLNMFRYGGTARAGFANIQIYGTYFLSSLFQEGKGPAGYDLYPYEVGIAFSFND
jgi:hypothetical protein